MRIQSSLSNIDALGSLLLSNDGKDDNSLQEITGGSAPFYVCVVSQATLLPVQLYTIYACAP